jgi:EmrB/QacA subfamily drug resistance transporter
VAALRVTVGGMKTSSLVAVILVAAFMDLLDVTIVAVAAPAVQDALDASAAQVQWMVAAYALSLGAALVTGGRIGDQYGRRRVFLAGLTGFVVASAACALAPTAEVMIATRVVQGLAAGLMVPQVFGIIRASLDGKRMAAALGAYGGVQGLASIAGPLLGGLLVTGVGWRAIFWVNVPIGLVTLAAGLRVLPESNAPAKSRLDLPGAGILAVSLLAVLLPVVQGPSWGWPVWGWGLLAAGVLGLVGFVLFEREVAAPVLDPGLLRNRTFVSGLTASMAFFGGIAAFFLLLSVYLQAGTGRSALATGLVTLPYAIGSMITSGIGVKLAGRRWLVTGSLTVAASHVIMYVVVTQVADPAWWLIGIPLLVGGLGLGLAAPSLVNVVLAGVHGRAAGSAGGVLSTVNQFGGSIGVAALGTLFFTHSGLPGEAFAATLPWQVGLYVAAALLMARLHAVDQRTGQYGVTDIPRLD